MIESSRFGLVVICKDYIVTSDGIITYVVSNS